MFSDACWAVALLSASVVWGLLMGVDVAVRPDQVSIGVLVDAVQTCPRAVKRGRHNNYHVKKPDEPASTRHPHPPTLTLHTLKPQSGRTRRLATGRVWRRAWSPRPLPRSLPTHLTRHAFGSH